MSGRLQLGGRFRAWRRRREAMREFDRMGPEGQTMLGRDLGVQPNALARLAANGPAPNDRLPRMMQALGMDLGEVAGEDHALARDMELVCAECRSVSRCARDLDHGEAAASYGAYCPNAHTLDALLREK